MTNEVLQEFADTFAYCFVCGSEGPLEIHHIEGGAARQHIRENLCMLCSMCHHKVHNVSGEVGLSKGQVLNAKRLCDSLYWSPRTLASLRHRHGLAYGCEPLPSWASSRRRGRIPIGRDEMINSREKGKRAEREAAAILNENVPNAQARRAQQYSGTEGSADLIAQGLPGLWLEVKHREQMNIHKVFDESEESCGELCPVVMHRKNNTDWLVTVKVEDIRIFVEQIRGAM